MITDLFQYRPGRVIAVCRLVLAFAFFLALWLDPAQPVRSTTAGYVLLFAYLVASVVLVPLAWLSWWWDHRFATVAFAIDVTVFLAAIYFTEGENVDFNSPFLAFFVFLMLVATIRWGWRATAVTGVAVSALYLAVGLGMFFADVAFDPFRFGRRVTYMVVLSLVMVWFGMQRREPGLDRLRDELFTDDGGDVHLPLDEVMAYGMEATGATQAAMAWSDREEPWMIIRVAGAPGVAHQMLSGDAMPPQKTEPSLFDNSRSRQLLATPGGGARAVKGGRDPLGAVAGFGEGLSVPFASTQGQGTLVLSGIDGMSADHLALARVLAREIAAAFDRRAMARLSREAAVARSRDAIARDLHDSVVQALAGASFRLEALRSWIRAGKDPDLEIAAIKQALRGEQASVRQLINGLRGGGPTSGDTDLAAGATTLARELAEQWGAVVEVEAAAPGPLPVPGWIAHEVKQLVREGVANAVRHGAAARIAVELSQTGADLGLAITDNGTGLAMSGSPIRPWSIYERVKSLGGTVALQSDAGGTRIDIVLPMSHVP